MNTLKPKPRVSSNPEKVKQILDLFKKYQTVKQVAEFVGCGQTTVKRILLNNNIHPPTRKEFCAQRHWNSDISLHTESIRYQIAQQYKSGLSGSELAKIYKTSASTIRKIAKEFNCLKNNTPNYNNIFEANKNEIIKLFKEGMKLVDLARMYDVSALALRGYLSRVTTYNVRYKAKNPIPEEDVKKVFELHNIKNLTMKEIGNLYNCTFPCVIDFFEKHNIPRRTKTESVRLKNHEEAILKKKLKALSKRKSFQLPSGKIINVMGYEDNFLRFVFQNNLLIEQDFEFDVPIIPYTQSGIKRKYVPDFFLPKLNTIVEIKSTYVIKLQGLENLECKKEATLNKGYKFCLILNNDFNPFLNLLSNSTFIK